MPHIYLKETTASEIRGKPTLRGRDSRGYWYDRFRQGEQIVERYIGEDTPELRAHLERHEKLRETTRGCCAAKPRGWCGCCAARAI